MSISLSSVLRVGWMISIYCIMSFNPQSNTLSSLGNLYLKLAHGNTADTERTGMQVQVWLQNYNLNCQAILTSSIVSYELGIGRNLCREKRIHRRKLQFCHVQFKIRAPTYKHHENHCFVGLKWDGRGAGFCVVALAETSLLCQMIVARLLTPERGFELLCTLVISLIHDLGAIFSSFIFQCFCQVHYCFIPDIFRNLTVGSRAKNVVMVMN